MDDADEDEEEDNDHAWLISHGGSWGLMTQRRVANRDNR